MEQQVWVCRNCGEICWISGPATECECGSHQSFSIRSVKALSRNDLIAGIEFWMRKAAQTEITLHGQELWNQEFKYIVEGMGEQLQEVREALKGTPEYEKGQGCTLLSLVLRYIERTKREAKA